MAQPFGKTKLKAMLNELDCKTEYDAWRKARPLDDENAVRIGSLADQYEGIPRLRELEGYLLLDAGDDETVVVFRDSSGTRREVIRQITATLPKDDPVDDAKAIDSEIEDMGYAADEVYDDFVPDEEPDYEVHATPGKPRAGRGNRDT